MDRESEIDFEEYLEAGEAKAKLAELYTSRHKFCFTHSADFDGIFSGEIVRRFFDGKVKIIPINYADDLAKDILNKWDFIDCDIIICDFCFSNEIMEELVKTAHSVTWLDHHISAIERISKLDCYSKIHGIQSTKHSGAYNTWCWFYNNMKLASAADFELVPEIIVDVSKYDTWTFKKSEQQRMYALQLGMKALGLTFGSELFDILLYEVKNDNSITYDMYQNLLNQILQTGTAIDKYNQNYRYKSLERKAFDITLKVKGKKLVGCCLNSSCNTPGFKYVYDKDRHDFCLTFQKLGDSCSKQWTYSIYIMPDKYGKVSAVDIAKSISSDAGGHVGAAGASTKELLKELR